MGVEFSMHIFDTFYHSREIMPCYVYIYTRKVCTANGFKMSMSC